MCFHSASSSFFFFSSGIAERPKSQPGEDIPQIRNRNKKMFGFLMGTLTKASQESQPGSKVNCTQEKYYKKQPMINEKSI